MSSVLEAPRSQASTTAPILRWVPIVLGLVVMYVPTYINMWKYFWIREDNAHGPLIVAVVAWLIWRRREVLLEAPQQVKPLLGGMLVALGLVLT